MCITTTCASLLNALVLSVIHSLVLCRSTSDPIAGKAASYDYVGKLYYPSTSPNILFNFQFHVMWNAGIQKTVIGGGTAGLAIASRLAKCSSVAVIDAGGSYEQDTGNLSTVPALSLAIPFLDTTPAYPKSPLMDWDYLSTPHGGAGNRQIHYAQGKTLGGSSSINTMAYHRATSGTYQRWADLVGDQSYQFSSLLPYVKKSTHITPPNFHKRQTPNATFTYDSSAFVNSQGGPFQV